MTFSGGFGPEVGQQAFDKTDSDAEDDGSEKTISLGPLIAFGERSGRNNLTVSQNPGLAAALAQNLDQYL